MAYVAAGRCDLAGGRVVPAMTATSARPVSATPAAGYEVRTWHASGRLRVDFAKGEHTSSLFATWNGHVPSVQVQNQDLLDKDFNTGE